MQSILGETLVTRSGSKVSTTPALAGSKYVAVYCSAHWCPPCRQFTPLLGEFFKSQAAALKVAVVFATGDRDEKSFKDYFARFACNINNASYFQFNLLHNSNFFSFHVQSRRRVGIGHALRRLPHRHVQAGMA